MSTARGLAPIARVNVAGASAADSGGAEQASAPKSGKDIVAAACNACHGTGVAGAPKIGDKAAWQPRFDTGLDAMVQTAISGKGADPAVLAATISGKAKKISAIRMSDSSTMPPM